MINGDSSNKNLRLIVSDSYPLANIVIASLAENCGVEESNIHCFNSEIPLEQLRSRLAKEINNSEPAVLITNPSPKHGVDFFQFLSTISSLFNNVSKALLLITGSDLRDLNKFGLPETRNHLTYKNTHKLVSSIEDTSQGKAKRDASKIGGEPLKDQCLTKEEINENVIKDWHQQELIPSKISFEDEQFHFNDFIYIEEPISWNNLSAVLDYLDRTLNQEPT